MWASYQLAHRHQANKMTRGSSSGKMKVRDNIYSQGASYEHFSTSQPGDAIRLDQCSRSSCAREPVHAAALETERREVRAALDLRLVGEPRCQLRRIGA